MVETIAELVREKKIEGISDLRDESDRDGMRVVVELKRDAMADVVLNQLYRFTPLQTTFGANMVALERRPAAADEPEGHAARPSSPSARRSSPAAPSSCSARRATAPTCWSASPSRSPISTRSSALIRTSPDPNTAREHADGARLAGRGRRAADRADRRSPPPHRRRRHHPAVEEQAAPSSICACSASPALGRDEIADELDKLAARSPTISTSCARAPASRRSSRPSSPRSRTSSPRRAGP